MTSATTKATAKSPGSATKTTRGPSPWSAFMKKELKGLKTLHPDKNHKELMTLLGQNWKLSSDNPKKQ